MKSLCLAAILAALAPCAHALTHTIVGAESVTSSSTSNGSDAARLIDQSGLSQGYVSGVTNFDAYMAAGPTHSNLLVDEWFSNTAFLGGATATLDFDLGSKLDLDGLVLWNEESRGIGSATLSASVDGVSFTPVATLTVANTTGLNYPAQAFGFGRTTLRYLRLDVSDCGLTGSTNGLTDGCSLGEVAFRAPSAVPLPASALLLGAGLAAFGWRRRRD